MMLGSLNPSRKTVFHLESPAKLRAFSLDKTLDRNGVIQDFIQKTGLTKRSFVLFCPVGESDVENTREVSQFTRSFFLSSELRELAQVVSLLCFKESASHLSQYAAG